MRASTQIHLITVIKTCRDTRGEILTLMAVQIHQTTRKPSHSEEATEKQKIFPDKNTWILNMKSENKSTIIKLSLHLLN